MRTLEYYIEKCDWQRERIAELEEAYRKQCAVSDNWRCRALPAEKRIAELEAQNEKLTSRGFVGAQEQIIARLRARLDAVAAAARLVVDDPVQINLQRLEQALEEKA